MKKTMFRISMMCLAALLLWGGSAWAVNLRFNVMYSPKHPLCREAFVPWADKVKEVTEGRVKVILFYSNALFKPKQAIDAVTARSADMGLVLPTYARSRLLANSVVELPMVATEKAEYNSRALWALFQETPEMQQELSGMKVLWGYMNPAFQLHFTEKKVTRLEEMKNLVISADGTNQSSIISAFGASVEAMPMVDVYLALQKGVIEGCFLPYAPLKAQKIAELVKYHTNADLMAVSFFVTVNKKVWGRIKPEDRKAIEKISGMEAAVQCGSVFDKYQEKDTTWMKEKGDEIIRLTPDA